MGLASPLGLVALSKQRGTRIKSAHQAGGSQASPSLVTRQHSQHRGKFEYKLGIKVQMTEEESDLLELFDGWKVNLQAMPMDANLSKISGPALVTLQTLAKNGQWWSAEMLYAILADIPRALAVEINDLFHVYYARQNWGTDENTNEVIALLQE